MRTEIRIWTKIITQEITEIGIKIEFIFRTEITLLCNVTRRRLSFHFCSSLNVSFIFLIYSLLHPSVLWQFQSFTFWRCDIMQTSVNIWLTLWHFLPVVRKTMTRHLKAFTGDPLIIFVIIFICSLLFVMFLPHPVELDAEARTARMIDHVGY